MSTLYTGGTFIPGTQQNFSTSASSQYSNTVAQTTSIIRIAVTQDTYVALGVNNPTVTVATGMLIPAGKVERLATKGNITQVAFLQVSTTGNISITEFASGTNAP